MNYSKYADKAYAKIKKYGAPCIVFRSGKKVYDKETNEYIGYDEILEGSALQGAFSQKDIDGTNIRSGDILLTCVLDGTPEVNNVIQYGGKKYTAVSISELNPGGNGAIYYKVQAR